MRPSILCWKLRQDTQYAESAKALGNDRNTGKIRFVEITFRKSFKAIAVIIDTLPSFHTTYNTCVHTYVRI